MAKLGLEYELEIDTKKARQAVEQLLKIVISIEKLLAAAKKRANKISRQLEKK